MLLDEFLDRLEIDRKDDDVSLFHRVFDRHRLGFAAELGCQRLRFRQISLRDDDVLPAGRQVLREPGTDVSEADDRSFHCGALPFQLVCKRGKSPGAAVDAVSDRVGSAWLLFGK